jgi:hypothetical protein
LRRHSWFATLASVFICSERQGRWPGVSMTRSAPSA